MAKLRPLIKNEELDIDDHRWGSGESSEWGGGYHIHKRFLNGRRAGIEIRVPIDRNQDIQIISGDKDPELAQSAMREIRQALEDSETRAKFAEDIAKAFDGITRGRGRVTVARRAAKRIAGHFGLGPEIVDEVADWYRGRLVRYVSLHQDKTDGTHHYIVQTEPRISISAQVELYPSYPWFWRYFR